jgi:hypothetical protein
MITKLGFFGILALTAWLVSFTFAIVAYIIIGLLYLVMYIDGYDEPDFTVMCLMCIISVIIWPIMKWEG